MIDSERLDRAPCPHRSDSLEQLEEAKPRELVARVVGEAEQADEVFDVRGFHEAQAAVFHVGDAAARELELEQVAVVRSAHQHRLFAQSDSLLAMRQDPLADRVDLGILVGTVHEPGTFTAGRLGAQPGQESLGRVGADRVGDVENRLARPVVAFEDDGRDRRKRGFDVEEVARARAAESVHGLRVVADDGQAGIGAAQRPQNLDLQSVDILIFVDADVIDLRREQRAEPLVGRGGAPVEQQVVEVDETEKPLALYVSLADGGELVDLVVAPRRDLVDDLGQRTLRVDGARIEIEEGALLREAAPVARRAELVADEIDDVGRVAGVEHGETLGKAERDCVPAQGAVRDGVERAADDPGPAAGSGHLRLTAVHHLAGGAAGERQRHDPFGGHTSCDQPGDSRRERGGLARARPRENSELVARERCRGSLLLVQTIDRDEHTFDHRWLHAGGRPWVIIATVRRSRGSCVMAHDLVIRGGTIVDGTGAPGFSGDVAVDGGRIAAVGGRLDGDLVVDADGATVTPGWVDVHTHYDGQATWDDQLDPSFSNGVTTLVMGNCGVGFAPCPPGEEATLIELMEGVEDIPGTALHEGVPWGAWSTFPQYLDFLDSRRYALDVAAQVAHGALRFQVMRDRGVHNEDATASDIAEMRGLAAEAIAAGAVGFSTSRTIFHRSIGGEAVPGTYATDLELGEIVQGMADGGGGVFEAITSSSLGLMGQLGGERFDQEHELQLLAAISRATGQKITFTTVEHVDDPEAWRAVLAFSAMQNAAGAHLYPQVASRPVGILGGLAGYHPFMLRPTYRALAHLPLAAQAQRMRDPDVKARILAEVDVAPENAGSMEMFAGVMQNVAGFLFGLDEIVDYEPPPECSFAAVAAARAVTPLEAIYDFLSADAGTGIVSLPGAGYMHGNLDAVREMIMHPTTVIGLADAGAHVKLICDGSSPSTQLTHWTRDRSRGATIPLEFMVEQQTRRTARLYGFDDRGTIEVGRRADLNVIDLERLTVRRPEVHDDLPAGGQRYLQPVSGYVATIVDGVPTREHDRDTGARPGRLLRSTRSAR